MTDWHSPDERESAMAAKWAEAKDKVRVLREALPKVMNYASCEYESSFRPHFDYVMGHARAALEKTK